MPDQEQRAPTANVEETEILRPVLAAVFPSQNRGEQWDNRPGLPIDLRLSFDTLDLSYQCPETGRRETANFGIQGLDLFVHAENGFFPVELCGDLARTYAPPAVPAVDKEINIGGGGEVSPTKVSGRVNLVIKNLLGRQKPKSAAFPAANANVALNPLNNSNSLDGNSTCLRIRVRIPEEFEGTYLHGKAFWDEHLACFVGSADVKSTLRLETEIATGLTLEISQGRPKISENARAFVANVLERRIHGQRRHHSTQDLPTEDTR